MLDVPSITFLSNYLQSYPSTLLVVSHDRAFLNEVATDIIHQHSERLDYYKGADFGQSPPCPNPPLLVLTTPRLILRHQGRTPQNGQTRIREPNGPTRSPPSLHRQIPLQRRQILRSPIPHQKARKNAHPRSP